MLASTYNSSAEQTNRSVIFGRLIGDRIGPMDGLPYLDFIVPGLILMAVITNSYANTVSSFYQSKFSHFIEELLIAPVPDWVILAGFVAGGVTRGLVVGADVVGTPEARNRRTRRGPQPAPLEQAGKLVEIGPTSEVFPRPRHPYTASLLAAVPVPDPGRRELGLGRGQDLLGRQGPGPAPQVGHRRGAALQAAVGAEQVIGA